MSSRTTQEAGPSLIDMGHPVGGGGEGFADFADFQSATANGEFNPRAQSQGKHIEYLA